MRPTVVVPPTNQSAPSGPAARPENAPGAAKNAVAPAVVMRPSFTPSGRLSMNHTAPSGPAAMAVSVPAEEDGSGNWVITPAVVMRPIALVLAFSKNHKAPSGPGVMAPGM